VSDRKIANTIKRSINSTADTRSNGIDSQC
jgi:bacterioferritin-associated ferredoxin